MGIQSGSERIRRDCYERETPNQDIIQACEILERYGVGRNLDFIGENPYEDEADRRETIDLLCRLPKPFYFNYFSLTYFPGVDLTERALRDGLIRPEDVEDVAQKGYHLWGGSLMAERTPQQLRWDVTYTMAVHGVPRTVLHWLLDHPLFMNRIYRFAQVARRLQAAGRWKGRVVDRLGGRPNVLQLLIDNTNRDRLSREDLTVQPNVDCSPLARPAARAPGQPWGESPGHGAALSGV
jgi:hypothetical protein